MKARRSWQWARFPLGLLIQLLVPSGADAIGTTTVRGFDRIVTYRDLSFVNAIAQSDDGWLWLATEAGVIRFDGKKFDWPNPERPRDPIWSLVIKPGGEFWIAHYDGTVERISGGSGRKREAIHLAARASLKVDGKGTVWMAGIDGTVLRADQGSWPPTVVETKAGVNAARLIRDQDGGMWAKTNLGWVHLSSLTHPASGSPVCVSMAPGTPMDEVVHCLFPRAAPPRGALLGPGFVHGIEIDRGGRLWVSTTTGLFKYEKLQTTKLSTTDGLAADSMPATFTDQDGNLWLGSHGAGLSFITSARFRTVGRDENLGGSVAFSVTPAADGGLWASTTDGLSWLGGTEYRFWPYRSQVPENALRSLFVDATAVLWAIGEGSPRLMSFDGKRFTVEALPSENVAESLAADVEGQIWIGTRRGSVIRRQGGSTSSREFPLGPLCSLSATECELAVNVIKPRRNGGLWLGTMQRGPFTLMPSGHEAHEVKAWGADSGLAHRRVFEIIEEEDGAVWIATDRGLYRRLLGQTRALTTVDGLVEDRLFSLLDDGQGRFWFTGEHGISSVEKAALRARLKGGPPVVATTYTVADGLNSNQSFANFERGSALTADGKLWFATLGGLVEFTPPAAWPRSRTPDITIESLEINGTTIPINDSRTLTVGPGRGDIRLAYTVPHFALPERVVFRHRLSTFDAEWSPWTQDREANYRNVPPGNYRLSIEARIPEGTDTATTSMALDLRPYFTQTMWFRVLVVFALGSLLLIALYLWGRRMRLAHRLVLEERARIARDLHDTLAQVFSAATFQLGMLSQDAKQNLRLQKRVNDVQHTIAQARFAARSAIQNLRAESLVAPAFEDGLNAIAALYGDAHIKVIVTGTSRPVPPRLQSDLLLIVQEAVSNAIEHGKAKHVGIELVFGERFELWVRDDGTGFDLESLTTREGLTLGLAGMKERVKHFGGELQLHSARGAGTEVGVTMPVAGLFRDY